MDPSTLKAFLASHRRRRRALRLGLGALAVAGLTVIGLRYSNTGNENSLPRPRPGKPQLVAPVPKTVPLAARDATVIEHVSRAFVYSAVFRRHVVSSWSLVSPALRQSLTRVQWASGAIPVVPYPAGDVRDVKWRRTYSYRGRVGIRVLFEPKPGARTPAEQFDLDIVRVHPASGHRWLVQSWTPASTSLEASLPPGERPAPPSFPKARLSSTWLVLLVSIVGGLIILLPASIGIRGWVRHRRAARAYARPL